MASPQARPSARNRRRQRSTRLTVATVLVGIAAAGVAGAVVSGTTLLISVAAVLAVLLGAAATRITYSELTATRVEAARDRAAQAQAYRTLAEQRAAENAEFVETMQGRLEYTEGVIAELEEALLVAQKRVSETTRKLTAETRRADAAVRDGRDALVRVEQSRAEAEARASAAILKVAELEQQLDVARAELTTIATARHAAEVRKRA